MNFLFAAAGDQVYAAITSFTFFLLTGGLLLLFVGRAATALSKSAQAHEKSAKAQQDTVYLLRELVTILKSKEEKKS